MQRNIFQKKFFEKEKYRFINIVDELIDRLSTEQDKWTIGGLINYLDLLYTKDSSRLENIESSNHIKYRIINLRLLDKQDNELFFVVKEDENEKIECIEADSDKYFFTKMELEKALEAKEYENIKSLLLEAKDIEDIESYSHLIQEIKKDNFSIDISDNKKKYKKRINEKEIEKYRGGWQHIIIDGCDNFPLDIINIILDTQYTYIGKDVIPNTHEALEKDSDKFNCIKEIIQRAIYRSVSKAKRDITMIAPIYYIPDEGNQARLSFALPLHLLRNEKSDCVLVFNYDRKGNKYKGTTLLNMKEALLDARVFNSSKQYPWL